MVAAVGEGVSDLGVGDRVVYSSVPRSYAEKAAVSADALIKLPHGLDAKAGAAVLL